MQTHEIINRFTEHFVAAGHANVPSASLILDDPTLGPELVTGPPLRLSRTPARTARPAPRLGEHTREVLDDIGVAAGREG